MFRAGPPFFGMKAGCFMLQSRAGGSSALRAPPSTGAASSGSGCALGVPPPLSSHPAHTSQALVREPEVRGAAEEGLVPAGEEDITEQALPSAGPPGKGQRGRSPIPVSPPPPPHASQSVLRIASTVDHGDPCPQDSRLVDRRP